MLILLSADGIQCLAAGEQHKSHAKFSWDDEDGADVLLVRCECLELSLGGGESGRQARCLGNVSVEHRKLKAQAAKVLISGDKLILEGSSDDENKLAEIQDRAPDDSSRTFHLRAKRIEVDLASSSIRADSAMAIQVRGEP